MPTPSVTLGLWLVGGVISSLKGFKKERIGEKFHFALGTVFGAKQFYGA